MKAKTIEANERDRVARDLEFEVESSKRKLNNMEGRVGELNNLSEKVMQYELKISRMNTQFQSFEREKSEFEDIRKENEALKRRVGQLG